MPFRRPLALLGLALLLPLTACESDGQSLDSLEDKAAYIIGFNFGAALSDQMGDLGAEHPLNEGVLLEAIRAGLRGDSARFDDAEMASVMQTFQDSLLAVQSGRNEAEGETFLGSLEGDSIQVTESGLRYKVIEEGSGPQPSAGNTVTVQYRGTFPNGEEFDSSYRRGQPARFPIGVGQVIPGWDEALMMMPEGSTWELYIPPHLAYGDRGQPPIGPNRTLIFHVELLDAGEGGAEQ